MAKHAWMAFYPLDFQTDTVDLDATEIGAYLDLLMLAWRREGTVPDDMAWLKCYFKSMRHMHGNTFNRVIPKLLKRYFHLGADCCWRNNRLLKELQIADKLSGKGKENAEKRWSQTKENNDLAADTPMPTQHNTTQRVVREAADNLIGLKAKSEEGPKHNSISRDRRFVYFKAGNEEWPAAADDYRATHGKDPVVDRHGGKWFALLGEAVRHTYRGK